MPRPIHEIAREIRKEWPKVNFAAEPYLDAMRHLDKITDVYFCVTAKTIVLYFLGNARSFTGEAAKRLKAELKAL